MKLTQHLIAGLDQDVTYDRPPRQVLDYRQQEAGRILHVALLLVDPTCCFRSFQTVHIAVSQKQAVIVRHVSKGVTYLAARIGGRKAASS